MTLQEPPGPLAAPVDTLGPDADAPALIRIPQARVPDLAVTAPARPAAAGWPTVEIGEATLMCPTRDAAVRRVLELAGLDRPALVVTANSDHIVKMRRDPALADAYRRADLAVIDGQPLVWTARLIVGAPVERVTGVDLFLSVCAAASPRDGLFLLGGSEANSARAAEVLAERYPGLRIVGRSTAELTDDTSEGVIREVAASGATIVAVFLGCPKQETWVRAHLHRLPAAAYLCLGGTVDIVSGALPRAGRVWQRLGLEWLHRLLLEPGRLWRRYLRADPEDVVIAARSV